jgi:hypothetical protein
MSIDGGTQIAGAQSVASRMPNRGAPKVGGAHADNTTLRLSSVERRRTPRRRLAANSRQCVTRARGAPRTDASSRVLPRNQPAAIEKGARRVRRPGWPSWFRRRATRCGRSFPKRRCSVAAVWLRYSSSSRAVPACAGWPSVTRQPASSRHAPVSRAAKRSRSIPPPSPTACGSKRRPKSRHRDTRRSVRTCRPCVPRDQADAVAHRGVRLRSGTSSIECSSSATIGSGEVSPSLESQWKRWTRSATRRSSPP